MGRYYAALIIDIKKSRSYDYEERKYIQYNIMDVLYELNQLYQDDIVREVEFSAGDEMQGLFESPEAAYLFYRLFSIMMHPVEIRAGIGVGDWDVRIENKGTTFQDGSAYHNARYAIECADDSDGYPVLLFSGKQSDITINTMISGAATIMSNQSSYQNQIMLLTELLYPIAYYCVSYSPQRILNIASLKNRITHELNHTDRMFPLDRIIYDAIESIEPKSYDEYHGEKYFFITSGKRRGISTYLSNILDITRQAIDKTLKTGNIYTARNMAINALYEIRNLHWER